MNRSASWGCRTKSASSLLTAIVGCLLLAGAVQGWLSDASISSAVWPADINAHLVHLLGGSLGTDALGQPRVELSYVSVAVRLLSGLGLVGLLNALLCRRRKAESAIQPTVMSADTWKLTGLVCAIGSAWWLLWILSDFGAEFLSRFCLGILPVWISLTVGMLLWIWWCSAFLSGSSASVSNDSAVDPDGVQGAQQSQWWPLLFLLVITTAWIMQSFFLNRCLYDQLLIPHGDSAMYEEHLWNVWHGKGFRSYLDQGLFLGEHIQVIHLLLLPLHMLWPSHLLLELAESVALGSCTIPLYLIARRHFGSARAAAIVSCAWLLYFPMHFLDIAIDQKTFRPIALSLPFLFWMIDSAERRRPWATALCLLLALSAKEDLALITFPLLAVMAIRERLIGRAVPGSRPIDRTMHRWLWGLSAFSAVYLVAAVLVIIPAFRSGDHVHYARYFGDLGGTPSELIRTSISHPMKFLATFFSVRTVLYVAIFLGPLAFFPLRKPLLLCGGILTFGMLALLQLSTSDTDLPPVPYHHFHAPLLPVLFYALITAIGEAPAMFIGGRKSAGGQTISQLRPSSIVILSRSVLVLLCCATTSATGSLLPFGLSFWSQDSAFGYHRLYASQDPRQQRRVAMIGEVLKQIPQSARVASTDYIHTRLTHCERSYDYSNYPRAVNHYQPGVPPDTEYIVIDTGHRYSEIHSPQEIPELRDHPDQWQLLPDRTHGMFIILKRR
ncbi:MAG: DUF2079 domain-containing protein [Planctomycetaceae bacterium]